MHMVSSLQLLKGLGTVLDLGRRVWSEWRRYRQYRKWRARRESFPPIPVLPPPVHLPDWELPHRKGTKDTGDTGDTEDREASE